MRVLIQRVSQAQVVNDSPIATNDLCIGKGMVILAGFAEEDSPVNIEQMTQKIKNLRIFADSDNKMNLSGPEVDAQYLVVSQFTLYADAKYGNRPSFSRSASKIRAKEYYEHFVATARRVMGAQNVKNTEFGSTIGVNLTNDGPVSLLLDSEEVL